MKNSAKYLLAATFAAFGLCAVAAPAPVKLTDFNVVSVALTLQTQNSFDDNGTVRTYGNPVVTRMNTKDLLNQLARDKFAQGTYSATSFPNGSQLVLSEGLFVVIDRNNNFIMDVSDIIQFGAGNNDVISGKVNDATTLANPNYTEQILVQLKFDDTAIFGGGNMSFFVQGVDIIKTSDPVPNGSGKYREITSDSVKNAAGEGLAGGLQFMVTGSIQGSRNALLTLAVQ
jgi:hypothetical protein